jgi:hypothetical protein
MTIADEASFKADQRLSCTDEIIGREGGLVPPSRGNRHRNSPALDQAYGLRNGISDAIRLVHNRAVKVEHEQPNVDGLLRGNCLNSGLLVFAH